MHAYHNWLTQWCDSFLVHLYTTEVKVSNFKMSSLHCHKTSKNRTIILISKKLNSSKDNLPQPNQFLRLLPLFEGVQASCMRTPALIVYFLYVCFSQKMHIEKCPQVFLCEMAVVRNMAVKKSIKRGIYSYENFFDYSFKFVLRSFFLARSLLFKVVVLLSCSPRPVSAKFFAILC